MRAKAFMKLVGVAAVAVVLAVGMAGCIEDDPDDGGNGKNGGGDQGVTVEVVDENTTILRGNLSAQLGWLQTNNRTNNTYILEVNADQEINPYTFISNNNHGNGPTIRLRGIGGNRTIRLTSNSSGNMFTVSLRAKLILESNITLQGRSNNNSGSMVYIEGYDGVFTLDGGTITGHSTESNGGAVYVRQGTFIMNGGTISDNKATRGGGVYLFEGVDRDRTTNFDMRGGTITGNTATVQGGGVWIANSNFATFQKSGGTITGYDTDPENGNAVMSGSNAQTGMGHAIYRSADQRRETTAGPAVDLRHDREDGWDD
jgi:hypothetical protein